MGIEHDVGGKQPTSGNVLKGPNGAVLGGGGSIHKENSGPFKLPVESNLK